jgi:hypothetical protein
MTIDSIIAIKKIESISAKYSESIDWIKKVYPNRTDLIYSLENSIIALSLIRTDIIMYDTKIEAKEWMES